jgi:hypothetical protein
MMIIVGKDGIVYNEDGVELSREEGAKRMMKYKNKPQGIGEYEYAEWLERTGGNIHEIPDTEIDKTV